MPTTRRLFGLAALSMLPGCGLWRHFADPRPPMPVLRPCDPSAADLVVMLPGAYSAPQDFVDEGFVAALTGHGAVADVLLADATMPRFIDGSVLGDLRREAIGPAQAEGRQRIWLVGISLGAMVALAYATRFPERIAGVVMIAPYPGRRSLLAAIAAAGGPAAWLPQARPEAELDIEFEAWSGLARRAATGSDRSAPTNADLPPLYVGYGEADRFHEGQRQMAATVPPAHRHTVDGGHDWAAWMALWQHWLARGLLPRQCPTAA